VAAVAFATLGIGFASVHVAAYVAIALGLAFLWPRLRGLRPGLLSGRVPRTVIHAGAVATLATPLVVYGLVRRVSWPDELAYMLLAAAFVGVGIAITVLLGTAATGPPTRRRPDRAALLPVLGWLAVLLLGFVLSNNLTDGFTHGGIRSVLGTVLPGYDSSLASRGLLGETPLTGLHFPAFSGQECYISGHCLSVGGFVGSYGFLMMVAGATWLALGRLRSGDEEPDRLRAAWLVMAAALSFAFLLVDFTGANVGVAWIMTRFIEVPYYGLVVLGTIVLVGSRDRLTATVGAVVIGAWTVVPVLYNLVPLQLVKNLDWVVGLVSK
jgi:hypothetical protein